MEDAEETGQIAANVLRIFGQCFDGIGRSLEQNRVAQALMLSNERAQRLRDAKGDQKMMARELALDLSVKPGLSFVVLAGGTVAIAAVFVLGAQDGEDAPIAFEDINIEKANAAVADAQGLGSPAVDVFALQEVLLEFGIGDEIGSFVVELTEQTDRAGVGFLSGFSFPIELQSRHHALIPIVHKYSPSKKR
jgi:hypothetical protein